MQEGVVNVSRMAQGMRMKRLADRREFDGRRTVDEVGVMRKRLTKF